MASKKPKRSAPKSPTSVIGTGTDTGRFFTDGDLPDTFLPHTGDPSLYTMPWLGTKGDWNYQPPDQSTRVYDRKEYIKLAPGSKTSDESSRDDRPVCFVCGTILMCQCGCCRRCGNFKNVKKPPPPWEKRGVQKRVGSRKRIGAQKKVGDREGSMQDRVHRFEAMTDATAEAEKLGRRLTMAATMFAAGFAYGTVVAKGCQEPTSEDEEFEEE